jgi:hypothetical protein
MLLIIKYVFGWKIDKSYEDCEPLRKGKHVIIYAYTSVYEIIIGYIVSIAYNIPIIGTYKTSNKFPEDMVSITYKSTYLNKILNMIGIMMTDKNKSTNTVKYISDELNKIENFGFIISFDGTKSSFYNIAIKTSSDVWMCSFDFTSHIISLKQLISKQSIQSADYEKIHHMIEIEMKKEKPYIPDKCIFVADQIINHTSVIALNRSIIIWIPPIVVIIILIWTLVDLFGN